MLLKAALGMAMIFVGGLLMLAGGAESDGTRLIMIGGGAVLIIAGFAAFIGRRSS